LSEAAQIYVGEDRFAARKKIIAELKEKGFLQKEEEYQTRVGYSQRSGAVVEPRISTQWFLKMKEMAGPALKAVMDGDIKIHPGDKFLATYKYWLENVKDWCISRQLWWGQQIPAWYDEEGNVYVAQSLGALQIDEPGTRNQKLSQDEDVLDTWFSSWLWPMEVFKGISDPGNDDINYYYPTSVLVTGQDIIFFWVARMIMAGMEYMHEKPFSDVYFTGMVRDKEGRKMSKSLGNSPDLLDLIKKYGADAVRFGIMISSPAGNDLLFDESSLDQGKHFNNKLWNALKLIKIFNVRKEDGDDLQQALLMSEINANPGVSFAPAISVNITDDENFAVQWFQSRLNEVRIEVENLYTHFRLSEALKTIYSLVWDDFCSWYLEWIKPPFGVKIGEDLYLKTIDFFEQLLQLLHPFMPFITEEIYHLLKSQEDDLVVKQFEEPGKANAEILRWGNILKESVTGIRDAKNKNQVKPKEKIKLHLDTPDKSDFADIEDILVKQVNAERLSYSTDPVPNSIAVVVKKNKFYIETEQAIDTVSQKNQLQKDLLYLKGFLTSVEKKLGNDKFVSNAKADVIELERKKQADALDKIKIIEESLTSLR
ncbi:MAG: class I tRNA ligase family protein, partial [Chitinophagaceae bacterium]|nr:class I tRNA ligase family protein [Chitinophagaceae bacterium]